MNIETLIPECVRELTPADSAEVEAGNTLSIMRAWRTEADPTREQRAMLFRYFGCCRYVWNWALDLCNQKYKAEEKRPTAYDLSKLLTERLNVEPDLQWLRIPPRNTIDYVFQDLDCAYKAFFRRIKAGENPGFPKYKSRNRVVPRCRFRSIKSCSPFGVDLPKIGMVRVKENFYLPSLKKSEISFATITYYAGKFWLSVTGECHRPDGKSGGGAAVISYDFSQHKIIINAAPVDVPGKTPHEDNYIRRMQADISRCVEGSAGYFAARERHQKWERRVAERRAQFLHNLSSRIVEENEEITVHRPEVKAIVEGGEKEQNKAILSNAMAEFFRQLSYKSDWYGRVYVEVGCEAHEL